MSARCVPRHILGGSVGESFMRAVAHLWAMQPWRWSTLITSGTNPAMFLAAPALGAASDTLGRKLLLILALIVLLVDVIALITFPSLGVIAAAAILGGAFNGSTAAITAALADLSFIQRHSFTNNFGLFYAAFGLALIVGPGAAAGCLPKRICASLVSLVSMCMLL